MTVVHFAQTLSFHDDPARGGASAVEAHARGAVAVAPDGRIVWSGDAALLPRDLAHARHLDHGDKILTAGLIDTHVHFPQWRMLAAPGRDLLEWLERFTFREEARYADRTHAAASA